MILSNRLGWIGVDIGTRCVKLAQVERTSAGVRLRHAAVIQRSAPWDEANSLAFAAPDTSDVEIRAALDCGGFRGRTAACLLPMNVCELRGLNVPSGSYQERRAMIASELADDWAELESPMEFDFWAMEADRAAPAAGSFNVDVLAASRPWVSQVTRDCQQARIECWAVDGAPLAIARAVNLAEPVRAGERVLAVDWGFSNTTICIVGNDGPRYTRRLHQCNFRHGLDAITAALDTSLDHAQHLVHAYGVEDATGSDGVHHEIQAAVTDALSIQVGNLAEEIQRTLRFFEQQRNNLLPSSVLLMGGGAAVRNIGPHFAELLGLPVTIWDMPAASGAAEGARLSSRDLPLLGNAVALSALAWRAA